MSCNSINLLNCTKSKYGNKKNGHEDTENLSGSFSLSIDSLSGRCDLQAHVHFKKILEILLLFYQELSYCCTVMETAVIKLEEVPPLASRPRPKLLVSCRRAVCDVEAATLLIKVTLRFGWNLGEIDSHFLLDLLAEFLSHYHMTDCSDNKINHPCVDSLGAKCCFFWHSSIQKGKSVELFCWY